MPINGDLLGYQRRSLPIGQIRNGTSIAGKNGRQPQRLETWRFTTASEQAAEAVAERYGGQVAKWEQRKGQLQVITDRTAIDVWVPPRGEAVDSSMELWDGPRRQRKCDGVFMSYPERKPCMCPLPGDPSDPDQVTAARFERERLSKLRPPQACKILTRFALTISDLPGMLGIWRLNTGSVNCAVESADSGEAMEIARAGGWYLPAVLLFHWRYRSDTGTPYPVPVLQLGQSMREVADHALPAGPGGLLRQLQGAAAGEGPKAIAAPSRDVPRPAGPATPPRGTCGQPEEAGTNGGEPGHTEQELAEDERRYQIAQAIADRARTATTSAQLTECATAMKQEKADDEFVYVTDDRVSGPCQPLAEFLREVWREKAREGGR